MKFTSSGRRHTGISAAGVLAVLLFMSSVSYAQQDSVRSETYIRNKAAYNRMYEFINYELNYIEWTSKQAIEPFFNKLAQSPQRKVKVLHIGDSHVQADFFPGFIRERMQEIFGYAGRGFVFPYACANTHATYDYRTFDYGAWECARNVQQSPLLDLGITGATVRTADSSAGFKFIFKQGILHPTFDQLKIYCKQSPQSFDLKLKISGQRDTIRIDCNAQTKTGYITVKLPAPGDTLQFWIDRNDPSQNFFECYGMMIESAANSGVLYNSVGINGAGYLSILRQSLFPFQLEELAPDLVIIDVGANDFYPRMIIEPEFQNNLAGVIEMVRKGAPEASIIVSCSQDIYKRSKNIAACKRFSEIARGVAFQKGCAFYDYYNVSGGQYSMLKWLKANLAKKDKVHLTGGGYNVKGQLYLNAMLNSYVQHLTGGLSDTFLVKNGVPPMEFTLDPSIPDTVKKVITDVPVKPAPVQRTILHKVRSGETIGGIAMKYGVTVAQIKAWNNLKGNTIVAGKTLKINVKGAAKKNEIGGATAKPGAPANTAGARSNAATYTVRSGDSLWTIAQKFNITVDQLKRLNGMQNNNIKPGMKIIVSE